MKKLNVRERDCDDNDPTAKGTDTHAKASDGKCYKKYNLSGLEITHKGTRKVSAGEKLYILPDDRNLSLKATTSSTPVKDLTWTNGLAENVLSGSKAVSGSTTISVAGGLPSKTTLSAQIIEGDVEFRNFTYSVNTTELNNVIQGITANQGSANIIASISEENKNVVDMNSPNLAKYEKVNGSGTVEVSVPDIIPDIPIGPTGIFVKIDFVLSASGSISLESEKDPSQGIDTFTSSFGVSGSAELIAGATAGYQGLCAITVAGSGAVTATLSGNLIDNQTNISATGTADFSVVPKLFVKGEFVGSQCTIEFADLGEYSDSETFGSIVLFNKN